MKNIYRITWKDSCSDSAWRTEKDAKEWAEKEYETYCVSIGWILLETKDYIVTAASWNGGDEWGELTVILKNTIVKKEKL